MNVPSPQAGTHLDADDPADNENDEESCEPSQASSFGFGVDDICHLFPTQDAVPNSPSKTTDFSSTSTLGKRSVQDISVPASPTKRPRLAYHHKHEKNEQPLPETVVVEIEGVDKESYQPHVIAHSTIHQRAFAHRKIPFGAQFEIARLVTHKLTRFPNVTPTVLEKLEQLKSNTSICSQLERLLPQDVKAGGDDLLERQGLFEQEKAAKCPWPELDKEADFESTLKADPTWFAGKVDFKATISLSSPESASTARPKFVIKLDKPELGPSNRFKRHFGSESFITIALTQSAARPEYLALLLEFLKQPFILLGRVYRAIHGKKNVVLYWTNEVLLDSHDSFKKLQKTRLSALEFIEWHNPLVSNQNQTLSKYCSRMALGFSSSVPGPKLMHTQVKLMDDIISSDGSCMTDGIGTMNTPMVRQIDSQLQCRDWPTAIQMRYDGFKGLLVHSMTDTDEEPAIWLRPSMAKISREIKPDDAALHTIDILKPSRARLGCRLSNEMLPFLQANGVPSHVIHRLFDAALITDLEPLRQWDGPEAMEELWITVFRQGNVAAKRAARKDRIFARAKGYEKAERLDDDDGSTDESISGWEDELSGCPTRIEEMIIKMLAAGFNPKSNSCLRELLSCLSIMVINLAKKTFLIEVSMAVTAFIVADETGVLQEGEMFFKSSNQNLPLPDGTLTDIIIGDVLITRSPCKLRTDIQKWKAVNRIELHRYTNVIVCSVQGLRRAADLLAGGDYDGDMASVIYLPALVAPFENAPIHFSHPPSKIDDCFTKRTESVAHIVDMPISTRLSKLQDNLLAGILDTGIVGSYSVMHDYAMYTLGIDNPETTRLAYMFTTNLDSAKSGLVVRPEILKQDENKYGSSQPALPWKQWQEAQESDIPHKHVRTAKRAKGEKIYILESLKDHVKEYVDKAQRDTELFFKSAQSRGDRCLGDDTEDAVLAAPWREHVQLAEEWQQQGSTRQMEDVETLKASVVPFFDRYTAAIQPALNQRTETAIRLFSAQFAAAAPRRPAVMIRDAEVDVLRASYAYVLDQQERKNRTKDWSRFPWHVAMRELCSIKARGGQVIKKEFIDRMRMRSKRA